MSADGLGQRPPVSTLLAHEAGKESRYDGGKRVGPQALVLSRFGALFVALVGSLISVYTDADICKIAFSAE